MFYCTANVQKLQEKTEQCSFYSEIKFATLLPFVINTKASKKRKTANDLFKHKPRKLRWRKNFYSCCLCIYKELLILSGISAQQFRTRSSHSLDIICPSTVLYSTTTLRRWARAKVMLNKDRMMQFPLSQSATNNNMARKHEKNHRYPIFLLNDTLKDPNTFVCLGPYTEPLSVQIWCKQTNFINLFYKYLYWSSERTSLLTFNNYVLQHPCCGLKHC